jgi:hypothetical protein
LFRRGLFLHQGGVVLREGGERVGRLLQPLLEAVRAGRQFRRGAAATVQLRLQGGKLPLVRGLVRLGVRLQHGVLIRELGKRSLGVGACD